MKSAIAVSRANDSIVTPEDVRSIDLTLREAVDFQSMIARQVCPPREGDHPGTETIEIRKQTREGMAKIYNVGGAATVPLADQFTTPSSSKVRSIVIGFQLTRAEKRAAEMGGKNPVAAKTEACQKFVTVKENELFFIGSTPHLMDGLIDYPGIGTYSFAQTLATATSAQSLASFKALWASIEMTDNYKSQLLVLNTSDAAYLFEPYSTTVPTTIYQLLVERGWWPAGIIWSERVTSGRAICLQNTADVLEYALPMDLQSYPAYAVNGMTSEVDFEERYGGVLVYRPAGDYCRVRLGLDLNSREG